MPILNDVRIHRFERRAKVEILLAWIDRHALPLDHDIVALDDAPDRVLAAPITAPLDVPGFDPSEMDGYALIGFETSGPSDYNPVEFTLLGQTLPGGLFEAKVQSATALRAVTAPPFPPSYPHVPRFVEGSGSAANPGGTRIPHR
jgi:molybdopterin biosynthesis enzyme